LAGEWKSARNFVDIAGQLDYVNDMKPVASENTSLGLKWRIGAAAACILLAIAVAAFFLNREKSESGSLTHTEPLPDFQQTKVKAETGNPEAQHSLGEIYAEGKQVRQDYAEAVKWYRKAADQGLAKAQYNLGVLYDIGQGVSKDEAEAAKWYRKAAEQGSADAQYTLASMYGLGRGVPADPKETLKWYQRAAEQGDALASYNLAERYERGKDVPADFVEAYKWHSLAAERGLRDAATAKGHLERQMTSEQLAEARTRIREFKARFPKTF
jgi:TPR repeat protein